MDDLLQDMTNKGVAMEPSILHAIIRGRVRESDVSSAIDAVQDLHNQHGVSPLPRALHALLQACLRRGDSGVFEAQRVAAVVRQIYSVEQREALYFVGADLRVSSDNALPAAHLSETSLERMLSV